MSNELAEATVVHQYACKWQLPPRPKMPKQTVEPAACKDAQIDCVQAFRCLREGISGRQTGLEQASGK